MNVRTLLIVALLLGVGAVGYALMKATALPPDPARPAVAGRPAEGPDTPAKPSTTKDEPRAARPATPDKPAGEDPNGYQRSCKEALDKDLEDFVRLYRSEVDPSNEPSADSKGPVKLDDALGTAGVRYYLRCTRQKTSAAVELLGPTQRQQVNSVRVKVEEVALAFRGLAAKAPVQSSVAARGELAREELMDQLIDALQPGQPALPAAVVAQTTAQAEKVVKGLRAAAERLAAENSSAAGDAATLKRLAGDFEIEMKRLPPQALTVLNSYLTPFALPPPPVREYHPAGWMPPPKAAAAPAAPAK